MTNPVFFEDPRTLTEARMIFFQHKVPAAAGGGDVQLYAVQLRAALACARIGDERAVEPLFALARAVAGEDPALRHAAIHGLEMCASEEQLALAARDSSVHARLAAVVADAARQEAPKTAQKA